MSELGSLFNLGVRIPEAELRLIKYRMDDTETALPGSDGWHLLRLVEDMREEIARLDAIIMGHHNEYPTECSDLSEEAKRILNDAS